MILLQDPVLFSAPPHVLTKTLRHKLWMYDVVTSLGLDHMEAAVAAAAEKPTKHHISVVVIQEIKMFTFPMCIRDQWT